MNINIEQIADEIAFDITHQYVNGEWVVSKEIDLETIQWESLWAIDDIKCKILSEVEKKLEEQNIKIIE